MLIRCGACQQRMAFDEELLGCLVNCPSCGTAVRIPSAVLPVGVRPARAPSPAARRQSSRGGTPTLVHRCPKCGSDVEHGNTLCPQCGVNIKRLKKRMRR